MSRLPRSETIDEHSVGIYHCYTQTARQRFLFGRDEWSGIDFSYRKQWVVDRCKLLAGAFAVDILDFAIMDNHLHLVLRNRPDIVETWTDREVARRHCFICPSTRNKDGSAKEPLPCEIDRVMQDKGSEHQRCQALGGEGESSLFCKKQQRGRHFNHFEAKESYAFSMGCWQW